MFSSNTTSEVGVFASNDSSENLKIRMNENLNDNDPINYIVIGSFCSSPFTITCTKDSQAQCAVSERKAEKFISSGQGINS